MTDNAGTFLRNTIKFFGLNPVDDIAYCYCTQCYGDGVVPHVAEFKNCSMYMWRVVRECLEKGLNNLLVFGGKASNEILRINVKMQTDQGKSFKVEFPKDVWEILHVEDEVPIPPCPSFNVRISSSPRYFLQDRKQHERAKLKEAVKQSCDDAALVRSTGNPDVTKDYEVLNCADEAVSYMQSIIDMFRDGEISYFALDLETCGSDENKVKGGLQPFAPGGRVVTIGLSHAAHFARIIPMYHPESELPIAEQAAVAVKLAELLSIVPVVGANIKFDLHWCRYKLGCRNWNILHDTQLMRYNAFLDKLHNGLKDITRQYLPFEADYEAEIKEFLATLPEDKQSYDMIPMDMLLRYAGADVDVPMQLIPILLAELEDKKQQSVYEQFAIHPYPAFIEMEQNGAYINVALVASLYEIYAKKCASIDEWFKMTEYWPEWQKRRHEKAALIRSTKKTKAARQKPVKPEELAFNFASVTHVAELLFDIVGLPIDVERGKPSKALAHIEKFAAGVPTTANEPIQGILFRLRSEGEKTSLRTDLLERLLQHRKDAKVLSGYLKKAEFHCPVLAKPDWWDTRHSLDDPRAYEAELFGINCQAPSFNLTTTATARLSSSEPNVQQVPEDMRCLYIPRRIESLAQLLALGLDPEKNPRRLIANFDVGQAELRVAASISNDPEFIAIMSDPSRDVHREIAARAHQKPVELITRDERSHIKAVVFGTLFGRGTKAVAAELKIEEYEAKLIQRALFNLAPGLEAWIQRVHDQSDETLGVWTPTGRYRDLSGFDLNAGARHRRAVNTPVQEAAHSLNLWATGHVFKQMQAEGIKSLVWNFVHDSIDFDCYPQEAERLMQISYHYFSTVVPSYFTWYKVPLVIEFEFGTDWGSEVPTKYNVATREITFSGQADQVSQVFEAFKPLLAPPTADPDWLTKVSNPAVQDKDVWISSTFL